jgi:hypothetical protein
MEAIDLGLDWDLCQMFVVVSPIENRLINPRRNVMVPNIAKASIAFLNSVLW